MNKIYLSKAAKKMLLAITVSGGVAMTLTSCEDTLEKPSFTADSVEYVFSDTKKSDVFVKGVYRYFAVEEWFRTSNTGDCVTTACEDDFNGSKWAVANYHFDPYMPYVFGDIYRQSYNAIESCNLGIKRIGLLEESPERNALLAELYVLRAFAYHNLIRFIGDTPAQWLPMEDCSLDDPDVLYPTRQPRDVIYDHIIQDMVDHVNDLPWQSDKPYVTNERLTRNAALGIMARICLHAAGYSLRWNLESNDENSLLLSTRDDVARIREIYDIADKALAEVIARPENYLIKNTPEESGFMNLFRNFTGGNYEPTAPEMMWMIAQQGEKTNGRLGNYVGVTGAYNGFFGPMKALQVKLPTYYLSFDPRDNRRDVTCPTYTIGHSGEDDIHVGTTFSSVMGGKYRVQWAQKPYDASNRNIDVPMLRYSDVLLMYAETQNFLHSGPTEAAKSALKEVRERAGIGDMPIPTGQEAFLEAVMQERMWELADEFVLRTDLIRTNLLDSRINATRQDMKDLSAKTGKYANVPAYRIYHKSFNEKKYGDNFLMVEYFDLTLAEAEAAGINTMPLPSMVMLANKTRSAVKKLVESRGYKYNKDWYPTRMFEALASDYNTRSRQICGTIVVSTFGMGSTVSQLPTGKYYTTSDNARVVAMYNNSAEVGNYPSWIDGGQALFYGYKKNRTELSPFAGNLTGHPLIDNPRLTQLPGYPGAKVRN